MLLLALAVAYVAVVGLVWIAQERLLFYPRPVAARPTAPPGWRLEDVVFTAADGTRLAGVLVSPPAPRPPLVIYFGGNAEEVTAFAPHVATVYGERAVLLVNYRGYGDSQGTASEKALVSDGIALYDWATRRTDLDAARIAVHGRSLGSGVAVQVAAARPVRCVILTTPFDSALAVAKGVYPWLPVGILMRHPFDSMARAPGIRVPALVLIGGADKLIAPSHAEKLAAAWGGPVERVVFEGMGHDDLDIHPRYDASVRAFLDRNL